MYCGEPATSLDHFPPQSVAHRGVLLPACQWCNSTLGAAHPTSFQKRCKHVKTQIERRHKRLLAMPPWDDDEIRLLGQNLRRDVTAWRTRKRAIVARVKWSPYAYLAAMNLAADIVAAAARVGVCLTVATTREPTETYVAAAPRVARCVTCGESIMPSAAARGVQFCSRTCAVTHTRKAA